MAIGGSIGYYRPMEHKHSSDGESGDYVQAVASPIKGSASRSQCYGDSSPGSYILLPYDMGYDDFVNSGNYVITMLHAHVYILPYSTTAPHCLGPKNPQILTTERPSLSKMAPGGYPPKIL